MLPEDCRTFRRLRAGAGECEEQKRIALFVGRVVEECAELGPAELGADVGDGLQQLACVQSRGDCRYRCDSKFLKLASVPRSSCSMCFT